MIPVVTLPPGDQWDQHMLGRLFANELYPTGLEFQRCEPWPEADGVVLIIPGRYWHGRQDEITDKIGDYEWVLLIRTGDEEDLFNINWVCHTNFHWWVQTPRTDRDYGDARLIPLGFPPHFDNLPVEPPVKDWPVFLSGQRTHRRRLEAFTTLADEDGLVNPTAGFTQGLPLWEYKSGMCRARVAPAPSGAVSPDSFRVWEALEAHCVPIADDVSPAYQSEGYWRKLLPDVPFPVYTDTTVLPGYIEDQLDLWPANANRIGAWWCRYKRKMAHWLVEDLTQLGAV